MRSGPTFQGWWLLWILMIFQYKSMVSWSIHFHQFIATKYCFSAYVRSGLYLYPNLYFICIGPRLHFMQKDIWTEILSLPLSDNQSDLADALKPNLCQRPLNHDFHTLGNILFYCCPLWIGEPDISFVSLLSTYICIYLISAWYGLEQEKNMRSLAFSYSARQ